MQQLITTIVGGLVILIIAGWLGIGSVKVVASQGKIVNKKWKWVIVVSWAMIIGGLSVFGGNHGQLTNIQANNLSAMMGLNLFGLGIIGLGIGKVGSWFNRP